MRLVCAAVLVTCLASACAELGTMSDGTSVSVGRPSGGYLVDAKRLPDAGDGFKTQEVWRLRNNRYGTDELLDLIAGVARRVATKVTDVKLVVADLSAMHGGGDGARAFHRSHQSGRDVDLVYYMRGPDGKPWEADKMRVFDANARARDGSGITIDIPRMWMIVRELVTAPEARVQWIFMYEPIAAKLIEHAVAIGEPDLIVARARKTLKQPGDSARHDDHFHVRVYCTPADKEFGCVDIGPMELYAEREAEDERARRAKELPIAITSLVGSATRAGASTLLHIDAAPFRLWR